MSHASRRRTIGCRAAGLQGPCENFLHGFKAALRAARAADSAAWSSLTLTLPLLPASTPVGWRERREAGAAEPVEVTEPRRI